MTVRSNADLSAARATGQAGHLLLAGLLVLCAGAGAQTLSSPITAGSGTGKGNTTLVAVPATDIPLGQGPGVHGANSPFPNLTARDDVVPWSVLTAVKLKREKNRIAPVFNLEQMALRQTTLRVQGFMMPLDPGEKQTHFLISSVPLTCAFCLPGGPESMVEVKTKTAVRYSMEPLVIEGRFSVLEDDPHGLYYRLSDAVTVK
jgi:uncharacterized protein